jgi:EamA domain-containing membrane protein RarD
MVGNGLNGEILAGISLTIFGIMMVVFGMVNQVAAILIPGDIIIVSIGLAVIILGVFTNRKNALIRSS